MAQWSVRLLKVVLAAALNGLGIVALLRYLNRKQVKILVYHGVVDEPLPPTLNSEGLHLSVQQFSQQMAYLARHYRVLSLHEVVEALAHQRPLPEYAVIVTFDDGYRNVYQHAWPVLQRYHLPVTLCVVTSFLSSRAWLWLDRLEYAVHASPVRSLTIEGGRRSVFCSLASPRAKRRSLVRLKRLLKSLPESQRVECYRDVIAQLKVETEYLDGYFCNPMSWDDLTEMAASPMVGIGSHAVHHNNLDTLGEPQICEQLVQSKALLEERMGIPVEAIAYPGGAYQDVVKRLARQAGYRCGLTTRHGFTDRGADLFELRRNEIGNDGNLLLFSARVSGAFDALNALLRPFSR